MAKKSVVNVIETPIIIEVPKTETTDSGIKCQGCESTFVPSNPTYTFCPSCNAAWQEQRRAEHPCKTAGCENAAYVDAQGNARPFCPACFNAQRTKREAYQALPKCACGQPLMKDRDVCFDCARKDAIKKRMIWSNTKLETLSKAAPKASLEESDDPTSVYTLGQIFDAAKAAYIAGDFDEVTHRLDAFFNAQMGNALAYRLTNVPLEDIDDGFVIEEIGAAIEAYQRGDYEQGHTLLEFSGNLADAIEQFDYQRGEEFDRMAPVINKMLHRIHQEAETIKTKSAREKELEELLAPKTPRS